MKSKKVFKRLIHSVVQRFERRCRRTTLTSTTFGQCRRLWSRHRQWMASISSHLSFSNAGKHFSVEIIDRSIFQLREVCFFENCCIEWNPKNVHQSKIRFFFAKIFFQEFAKFSKSVVWISNCNVPSFFRIALKRFWKTIESNHSIRIRAFLKDGVPAADSVLHNIILQP